MKYVMGLDPGFASFGVVLLQLDKSSEIPVHMDVIRTTKSNKKLKTLSTDDNFRRTQILVEELSKLLMAHEVVAIGAEAMSFTRNASSSAKLGMSWGVIASLAFRWDLPVFQCSPQELKLRVAGSKQASKQAVADAMRRRYPDVDFDDLLKKLPFGEHEHAWDALASVVACLGTEPVRMIRRMM